MKNTDGIITPFNNPLIRFISEPRYKWLRHTLFILLGLVLAFKGDVGVDNPFRTPLLQKAMIIGDVITFICMMGMIYLIILVLIPRLLFRSKVFLFAICIFVLITAIFFMIWIVDIYYFVPMDPPGGAPLVPHIEFSLMSYIQMGAVSAVLLGSVVGLVVFKKWINDVQHMNELHETNLRTELEQLKSQVNPHFLFNTLNNLLVLTKKDPEKASVVLLGLSDLLRYQLYDSAHDKILLTKDIEFIQNLLSLEKIRKTDFDYQVHTEGDMNMINLSPFLFIPFVENAIKHGASTIGHSYLNLYFRISGRSLQFIAENSKPPIRKNSIGGLGLKNINRRLELLYSGRHTLEIKDERDKYVVNLTIPL
jgi:Histidine kinase